jgi:hypothetical protein
MATWNQIAVENQTVTVEPGATVRYGASATGTEFVERVITAGGNVTASNAFFGSDPARGKAKFLFLLAPATAPTPAPAPQPTEPGLYVYTGPVPAAPAAGATDAEWTRYLAVQRLLVEAAQSESARLDRASRAALAAQQQAVATGYAELAKAIAELPAPIIQRAGPGVREMALKLMTDLPRRTGETADELAARALDEAQALARLTP